MHYRLLFYFSIALVYVGYPQGSADSAKPRKLVFGLAAGTAYSYQTFAGRAQENADFALQIEGGVRLNKRFAVLISSSVSTYLYQGVVGRPRKRDFGVLSVAFRYAPMERFSLTGGAGLGVDAPVFFDMESPDKNKEETRYYAGPGCMGSLAYTFYRTRFISLDVRTRLSWRQVMAPDGRVGGISTALLIGLNFN